MAMTPQQQQRLYLVTPRLEEPAAFLPRLEDALGAGDIAAVLVRLADADERTLIDRAKEIATAVQRRDVALLLDGRPEIAARAGADGAHLHGPDAFAAALALLKPDRIAGAGGFRSRHDAMLAGEANADYVMFAEPGRFFTGDSGGRRLPFDEALERLEWWAELFEIPCVGYAAGLHEVAPLQATGADFIALGEWIWDETDSAGAIVAAAAKQLAAL